MSIPPRPAKCPNSCADPGRTREVRAVDPGRPLRLGRRACGTPGTSPGISNVRSVPLAPFHDRSNDLGDHVAGLLEDDPVADPDVLAPDLVEVVEGRPGDRRPRDLDRDRCATGVSVPVRPTYGTMSSIVVSTCSGGNLYAMAHRGARLTMPRRSCWSNRSTLTTTPSVSYGSACRASRHCLGERDDAVDVEARLVIRGSPASPSRPEAVERLRLGSKTRSFAILE